MPFFLEVLVLAKILPFCWSTPCCVDNKYYALISSGSSKTQARFSIFFQCINTMDRTQITSVKLNRTKRSWSHPGRGLPLRVDVAAMGKRKDKWERPCGALGTRPLGLRMYEHLLHKSRVSWFLQNRLGKVPSCQATTQNFYSKKNLYKVQGPPKATGQQSNSSLV